MRIVSRTVPHLVEAYPYDAATGPRSREESFLLTRGDAEVLANDTRTMQSMPLNLNHRPDAPVGKVAKGWVHDNSLYHLAVVHDEFTKSALRKGDLRNTSLFHVAKPRLSNVELTLCALKGSRPGSGVIDIYDDDVDNAGLRARVPGLIAASDEELNGYEPDEKDDYANERTYYSRYATVAASAEIPTVVVPSFADAAQPAALRMSSSEILPANPAAAASVGPPAPMQTEETPSPAIGGGAAAATTTTVSFTKADGSTVSFEKKVPEEGSRPPRASDELEAKMKAFEEKGVRPDDALPDENYQDYLMRKFSDSKMIPSQAMKMRIMKDRLEGMKEKAKMRDEAAQQAQVFSNAAAPLLAKYGDKFQPGTTFGEVEQARAQNNALLLAEQAARLNAVAASDHELFRQRTEMEIKRAEAIRQAEEASAHAQELRIRAAAEERETAESAALRAQMSSLYRAPAAQQQPQRMNSSSSSSNNPYLASRIWDLGREIEHEDPMKQQQIMSYLRGKTMAGKPNQVLLRTREEYAKANGIAPPAGSLGKPYVAGQYVACSDDEIFGSNNDHTIRAYTNPWSMGLDKISMTAAARGVPMDGVLRSMQTREVLRTDASNPEYRSWRRGLYSNEGGVGEAPNPMRHATASIMTAQRETMLGLRPAWPAHCLPGWQKPPQKRR